MLNYIKAIYVYFLISEIYIYLIVSLSRSSCWITKVHFYTIQCDLYDLQQRRFYCLCFWHYRVLLTIMFGLLFLNLSTFSSQASYLSLHVLICYLFVTIKSFGVAQATVSSCVSPFIASEGVAIPFDDVVFELGNKRKISTKLTPESCRVLKKT